MKPDHTITVTPAEWLGFVRTAIWVRMPLPWADALRDAASVEETRFILGSYLYECGPVITPDRVEWPVCVTPSTYNMVVRHLKLAIELKLR